MPKTNVKLYATDYLATQTTTTINYINPSATKQEILNFTHALNNLTDNTYNKSEKIVTTDLDNESDTKPIPTLTISNTNFSTQNFALVNYMYMLYGDRTPTITYTGDGDFFIDNITELPPNFQICPFTGSDNTLKLSLQYPNTAIPQQTFSFRVGFTETNHYAAVTATITLTVGG